MIKLRVFAYALFVTLVVAPHALAGNTASSPQNKKSPSYVAPTAELLKRVSPAVVRITVQLHGVPLNTGAGFFISADGVVITSRRLVRGIFTDIPVELEFATHDRKIVRDYKVINCDPIENSDLCSFKLGVENRAYFTLLPGSNEDGDPVNVVGHPRGLEWTITRGAITKKNGKLGMDSPLAIGNEGGPAFDDNGHLVGVTAHDNSILSARDITSHLNSEKLPLSLADTRRFSRDALTKSLQKRTNEEVNPAMGFAARGKPIGEMKGFHDVALRFDDKILRLTLPKVFSSCTLSQNSQVALSHSCGAYDDSVIFSIRRLSAKGNEKLLEKNRRLLHEPRLIDVVGELQHADQWDSYEAVLTDIERRAFVSQPGVAQCQKTRALPNKSAAFSEVAACRFIERNDGTVGSLSVNIWLVKSPYLYELSLWVNNSVFADHFSNVPTLAVLTGRWEKSVDSPMQVRALASDREAVKPVPVYRVELPSAVGFMGTKIVEKKPQVDLYGKPMLLDRFESGYVVGVSAQNRGYLPPDYEDATRQSAIETARALDTTLQSTTIETESATVAGKPARILTAFGKNKTSPHAAITSVTVFLDEQTYVLTQITNKDPGDAYREFKALISGFKFK